MLEEYLEYCLLAELCRIAWQRKLRLEVLRAHTDQGGYDILLEVGNLARHVQLKATYVGGKTTRQKINSALEKKSGGCVIWMFYDQTTLQFRHFLWFGERDPRKPPPGLGNSVARHTKGDSSGVKSERPRIRVLNKGQFDIVESVEKLAERLFPPSLLANATNG